MRCPYLKEANVKQCSNSAWRKMIVQQASEAGDEKCLSPAHANCAVYRRRSEAATSAKRCPYLEEKLAEYCAAATIAQMVPQTDALSRCHSASYKYCEVFHSQNRPRRLRDGVD